MMHSTQSLPPGFEPLRRSFQSGLRRFNFRVRVPGGSRTVLDSVHPVTHSVARLLALEVSHADSIMVFLSSIVPPV